MEHHPLADYLFAFWSATFMVLNLFIGVVIMQANQKAEEAER
jgi:hypothetical protein